MLSLSGIPVIIGRLYRGPLREWLPSVLLAAGAIAVWEGLVRALEVQRWLLPAPSVIVRELFVSRGLLLDHAATTLTEVILGFGFATSAGILLAGAIASSRLLERSIYPFIIASQTIPYIAIAPLLLVWVGPEITSKVIVVALISFFPIVVNLVDGLRSTDRDMVNVLRTLGASPLQLFLKLHVHAAVPYLTSGLKVAAVVSVIGAVVGEWVGAQGGLGWLMKISGPQFQTPRVFASIVVLSAMAILLFALIAGVERWLLRNYRRVGE
jgi:putative hydroxymethylpyrimidine transport system permease protein